MKTLTKHDMYLIPRGYQSMAVDSEGVLSAFECRKSQLIAGSRRWIIDPEFKGSMPYPSIVIGYDYNAEGWKNSARNKEY